MTSVYEYDAQQEAKEPHLKAVTLREFLEFEFPPREMVLDPIIPTQGTAMLFAIRGVGKTFVGLNIAFAVASGGAFLRWTAPKPRRVVYVDGEMPAAALQERLAAIAREQERELPSDDHFRLITPDQQSDFHSIPDLTTEKGQAAIEEHLEGVELLVLDNLSTLCRNGKENEAESWEPIQTWALSLRKRGISVLFVHHAGKSGRQRGTSKREDILDTVIRLERPSDYTADQGARFEVHYDKLRGVCGDEAKPFEAMLQSGGWSMKSLDDALTDKVHTLREDGLTQREIASELGIGVATVNRHLKKVREQHIWEAAG